MSIPIGTIINSIFKALPGLLALIKAFGKKDEPTSQDITDKAVSEIEKLESWKKDIT